MKKTDTIAAVSTPRGTGGIAVIRISGGGAFDCAAKVFVPASHIPVADAAHAHVYRGNIVRGGVVVDDVMASFFRAPRSYTGEDTVEISCHGGVLITEEVLSAVFAAGARPAEAGEFTRRAFTSGKLSLSDAEAIGETIHAKTRAQLAFSSHGARGALDREVGSVSDAITDLIARVAVRIDYPEEDLSDIGDAELADECARLLSRVSALRKTYRTARAVMCGIDTVICGRPNAGKSTLYNLFTGEDSAIVTDIPGTTRDTLTSEVTAGSVLLRLSDTAGIRQTDDAVEKLGVERAREKIGASELLISVHDASVSPAPEDRAFFDAPAAVKLAVINKTDRADAVFADEYAALAQAAGALPIRSALINGCGFAAIVAAIEASFTDGSLVPGTDAVILNARQSAEAEAAEAALSSALDAARAGLPIDIVASELTSALAALRRLDGRDAADEVISAIFSRFCVGK